MDMPIFRNSDAYDTIQTLEPRHYIEMMVHVTRRLAVSPDPDIRLWGIWLAYRVAFKSGVSVDPIQTFLVLTDRDLTPLERRLPQLCWNKESIMKVPPLKKKNRKLSDLGSNSLAAAVNWNKLTRDLPADPLAAQEQEAQEQETQGQEAQRQEAQRQEAQGQA
jgi:hypothetical protein